MVLGADVAQLVGCCSVPLMWFSSDGELELFWWFPHSCVSWWMLAVSWDFSGSCWSKYLQAASLCGLGFRRARRPGAKNSSNYCTASSDLVSKVMLSCFPWKEVYKSSPYFKEKRLGLYLLMGGEFKNLWACFKTIKFA